MEEKSININIKELLNEVAGALHKVIQHSYEPIFSAVQNTLYHQASYTIILLVVIFWLLRLLKTGYPTREELFEAGKWIGLVCFIYAIFYSYAGYIEFIKLLSLPASWLRNATGGLIEGDNIVEIVTQTFKKLAELNARLWNQLVENYTPKKIYIPVVYEISQYIPSFIGILPFLLFYLSFAFLMIGIILIVQVSGYIALIVLSIAPVMIPLLFNRNLRAYFFSWLNLYISYSLYAPLALIILGVALSVIQKSLELPTTEIEAIAAGFWSIAYHFSSGLILSILCIYLLLQIPNWVSQVMRMQGLINGGVGAGVATMAGAGVGVVTGGAGSIAGGMLAKAQGESILKGATSGGLKGLAQHIPGAKTYNAIMEKGKTATGGKAKDAVASVE
ncbi:type IV secretion system protein [Helicobacter sp. UBA3407]|uniref:type IV secretion system protein n=3 Tax=Helicobacteraceae TaxID=72293 RepID=UPI002605681E|nr:type IV secretion system protein [Helicobacter sp. UBA3407]